MREILNTRQPANRVRPPQRSLRPSHPARRDLVRRNRTGDIMARLTNDLGAVRMAAGPAIMYLMNTVAGALFALVFMLSIDRLLTLLALLPMIALPIITAYLGGAIHRRFEAVQEHFSTLTTHAQENLTGTRIVRAYRQENAEIARFSELNDEYMTRNMSLARLYGTMHPMFALAGGHRGRRRTRPWRNARAARNDIGRLLRRVRTLPQPADVAADRARMGHQPVPARQRVDDPARRHSRCPVRGRGAIGCRRVALSAATSGGRAIEFRNVRFHFPAAEGREPRWVLRNVSFVVPAGATFGVVGSTGSGKTALMDLIPRIYDPQEGEILIDGVPIRRCRCTNCGARSDSCPRRVCLFSDTIGGKSPLWNERSSRGRVGGDRRHSSPKRSTVSRENMKRCSASAVSICRADRSSALRSPVRSRASRRSFCSMMH